MLTVRRKQKTYNQIAVYGSNEKTDITRRMSTRSIAGTHRYQDYSHCITHNKPAYFSLRLENGYTVLYCSKCAILLTSKGLRLEPLNNYEVNRRKMLESWMHYEVYKIRQTFRMAIYALEAQATKLEHFVMEAYATEISRSVESPSVPTFKPNKQFYYCIEKIKNLIGRVETIKMTKNQPDLDSSSRCLSTRSRPTRQSRPTKTAYIFIYLCYYEITVRYRTNTAHNRLF